MQNKIKWTKFGLLGPNKVHAVILLEIIGQTWFLVFCGVKKQFIWLQILSLMTFLKLSDNKVY